MTLPTFNVSNLGAMPSVSEVIVKHIREAIVSGQIAEDDPIRQDEIAKLFNVSKIPVREALKQLEAEGLVEFKKNRGAIVTRISEEELAQIFEVRVMLETKLIRLAVPNMTDETFANAEQICSAFVDTMDIGSWTTLNWQLHACLYEPAQRPYMLSLIRSIYDKIERYLRLQMSVAAGKSRADQEHKDILQACKNKDVELAARLIEEHINGVCQSLYDYLPSHASK
ncbi:GntR family transcriptional regulator [Acinetobacter stercoris]|uniref:HTH-type transcriptional repressor CsiR n=1 Tax=Acinetobacter stercoris TaxID=2126983 RepID=A0A2U3N3F7_9GAMM|nr:GntR family transcriptional regulator [Acinetobacter stercoris]SPL72145.1 HTH-type transcriptional repressor CsiR [Acinetobacter stercoris]